MVRVNQKTCFQKTGNLRNHYKIFAEVEKNGDLALINYTEKFDSAKIEWLDVSPEEISNAENSVSEDLKLAIQTGKKILQNFMLHKL